MGRKEGKSAQHKAVAAKIKAAFGLKMQGICHLDSNQQVDMCDSN